MNGTVKRWRLGSVILYVYVRKERDGENERRVNRRERKWIIKWKRIKRSAGEKPQKLTLNFQMRIQSGGDMWTLQRLGASGMLRLTVGRGLCQPSSMDTHRSHEGQSITARTCSQEFELDSRKAQNRKIRRQVKVNLRVAQAAWILRGKNKYWNT